MRSALATAAKPFTIQADAGIVTQSRYRIKISVMVVGLSGSHSARRQQAGRNRNLCASGGPRGAKGKSDSRPFLFRRLFAFGSRRDILFQFGRGTERHRMAFFNFNGFAGLWIAACAFGTIF